jgi:hypothetical protein
MVLFSASQDSAIVLAVFCQAIENDGFRPWRVTEVIHLGT